MVVTHDVSERLVLIGGLGRFRTPTGTGTRYSIGRDYTFNRYIVGGLRVDDALALSHIF